MRDYNTYQEKAYQQTARLVLVFAASIMGTVATTGVVVGYLATVVVSLVESPPPLDSVFFISWIAASVPCGLVVFIGSLTKWMQLRDGGAVVARELGGTLIDSGTQDLRHRQILNVVEEIAIASGIPVPPTYVLERETGINAFAAGYSPHDAVIAVTDGCLRRLSRDQLQSVVAHEFSHILNGDMRINLRAIGLLHGVFVITICAEHLMREGHALLGRPSDDGDSSLIAIVMIAAGAALWPVGLIGMFFGLLIKAAVNRQREYLADASAVQFTRHPEGLAGALKVIGGYEPGSRIRSPLAIEMSHLFFAKGYLGFGGWLDSHPPLDLRIRRLDPQWDGVPLFESDEELEAYRGAFEPTMNFLAGSTGSSQAADLADATIEQQDGDQPDWRFERCRAAEVADRLPSDLMALAREPEGACVVLRALWWVPDDLSPRSAPEDDATLAMLELVRSLNGAERLLLFDTSVAALKSVSGETESLVQQTVGQLRHECPMLDLFRWAWLKVVLGMREADPPNSRYGSLEELADACSVVLSAVVHSGGDQGMAAQYAFERGAAQLEVADLQLLGPEQCGLEAVDQALEPLAQTAPRARQKLALAFGACITSDREVTENEALMIRGIYAALHLPLPRVLPGQPVLPGA